jgi:3-oxo-5-alpha-steroid 4-dehydrogenase 3
MVDGRQIPTIALFTVYSVAQNNIHRFLATLPSKSHQLPSQGLFPGTLCPHYGYEVFLYAVLAFGWGMEGSTPTMDAVLRFVAVNLFISARQKQKWYREQFGAAAIKDRTLMFTSRWFETVETALGSLIPEL